MQKIDLSKWMVVCGMMAMSACKKTDNVIRINSELKRDFNFGKGTYWIYRDSSTGNLDTFLVNESYTYIEDPEAYPKKEIQTSRISCRTDFTYKCFYKLTKNFLSFTFTHYKVSLGFEYDKYNQLTTIDNYSSSNLSIDSLKELRTYNGSCYIKKGIGFVVIKIKNDTFSKSWELLDYHIVSNE